MSPYRLTQAAQSIHHQLYPRYVSLHKIKCSRFNTYKTHYMVDSLLIELLFVQDASGDVEEKLKLESTVNELQKKLTEEATAKKQITLLLLEDRKKMATLYLEEKKRSEDLNHLLREEKSKVGECLPYKLLFPYFSYKSKISFTLSIH